MKAILIEETESSKIYRIQSKSGKFFALVETADDIEGILKFYKGRKRSLGGQVQFH